MLNVGDYFGNFTKEFSDQIIKNHEVDRFLDNGVCSLLCLDIRNSQLVIKNQVRETYHLEVLMPPVFAALVYLIFVLDTTRF